MRTLLLLIPALFWCMGLSAQINVSNDFEGSLNGWTQTGGGGSQADRACNGSQSFQDNVWSSSTTGSLQSPGNTETSADEVTIDFTYKIQNFNNDGIADPYDGTVTYGYSLNGGATVNLGTLPPTATCTAIANSIAAGTITAGDEIVFHFDFTRGTTGDWDVYVDDFSATQPGACIEATATYTIAEDCANDQFSIDVMVTDPGSATTLTIADDQGSATQAANLAGANTFGPYTAGTDVVFTVTNDQNMACVLTSSAQTFACPPPNDECAGATPLVCNAAAIDGTTAAASDNADDVGCGQGPAVWYTFVGAGLPVTITVDPTFDAEIGIATGTCGAFTPVDCNDGSFGTEVFSFTPDDGVTYYITIGHFSDASTTTGDFTIELECETCLPPTASLAIAPTCNVNGNYEVTIDVTDFGSATSITVADGTSTEVLTAAGEVIFMYAPGSGTIDFTVTNDQDASCELVGSFDVPTSCPPANASCANAAVLTINSPGGCPAGGITVDMTGVLNTPNFISCDGFGDYVVFYTFTAPASGELQFDAATGSNPSAGLEVFSGDCSALTSVGCLNNLDGTITGLTPNDTYYAAVWTDTQNATIDFCVEEFVPAPPPPNDACADAIALTDASGMPTAASGATNNTSSADPAMSAPASTCGGNSDDDIWFTVTVPNGAGDIITIEAEDILGGTTVDLVIALYSGDCDNLVQVACADNAFALAEVITYIVPAARGAAASETFLVQAYAFGAGGGEFTVSASVALPVDLTSFTGQAMEKANKLTWTTAREEAADRYVVERSSNASNWSAIGEVLAAGDSDTELNYELMDESPLANAYYRLRMVDLDGTFTFSNIVELTNNTLRSSELSVYPVPSVDQVTVSFKALAEGQAQILLTDLTGRTVSEQKASVSVGQNTSTLNLQERAPGIYLLRVNVDGQQLVRRVIKR